MSRIGQSPLKGVRVPQQAAKVTVVLLTCIPSETGYYANRFPVLKVCLNSLWKHTDVKFDLMVVDNGSTDAVVQYLTQSKSEGRIQYLLLNGRNVGKGGAWNMAFPAVPGEIIAFTDDDVFFYPNWLSKHLEILENFPQAGLVCGQLIHGDGPHEDHVRVAQAAGLTVTPFEYPYEWFEKWMTGIGGNPKEAFEAPAIKATRNYILEKGPIKAYAGANGFSCVFRKSLLSQLHMLPFPSQTFQGKMDDVFQEGILKGGYLTYATFDKTTDHIGNTLDDYWRDEIRRYGIDPESKPADVKKASWARSRIVRAAARGMMKVSFKILQAG